MAQFEITTDRGVFRYETEGARLTDPQGQRVDLSRFAYTYIDGVPGGDQAAFSRDKPVVGKDDTPKILKIQLGLGCNMSCSYCSQGGQVQESSSTQDAMDFVASLDWMKGAPDKIEFWGGEPMLYWKKIEAMAPALRARFPDTRFSIVTNGTLLTVPRARFLHKLGFTLAVSHDGPGQALRGEDPFANSEWLEQIRYIFKMFGERICFNSVITPQNTDLVENFLWFSRRIGFPVMVNIEDIVTDYREASWTDAQLEGLAKNIKGYVSSGLALVFPRLRWSVQQFMETLAIEKPLTGSSQVCNMDKRDHLAVDLHGNVLTCQNSGANSGHKIGHVEDLAAVRLDTSTSWAKRPDCPTCPVVHLCYGSCMFLEGEAFKASCHASYSYNRAILEGAIYLLTGATVLGINHTEAKRPRRVIPIKVMI